MTRLHEILAVEGGYEATYRKILAEKQETFTKRADHFIGSHAALEMFDDTKAGQNVETHKEMVTTVPQTLRYVAEISAPYYDTILTKDAANQRAVADIEVDGVTIVSAVPVTTLLGLESKLTALRNVYDAIPTLAPGRKWERDETRGQDVWLDIHPAVRLRTQKTPMHKVLVEPTNHHPAQVEKWFEDVPVGRTIETVESGMLSPHEKSLLLGRVDTLLAAVKKARQRANSIEIEQLRMGRALFQYIHTGGAA